jgi:hypothetical protein
MASDLTNIAASVHQRLLNKAKETGRPFNELLQYFAIERFLYRLSRSPHADRFILKGALMFAVWSKPTSRPTMDIDLLGNISNNRDVIIAAMRDACDADVEPDGLSLDTRSITAARITEDAEYEGVRVRLRGNLGNARVSLQVDIGFGDIVVPSPGRESFPTLLDFPSPRLYGYSKESTIAEKFRAMVNFGDLNSRMKDFYDIWMLCNQFDFDGEVLAEAIEKTFAYRKTPITEDLTVFQSPFAENQEKEVQWRGFTVKAKLDSPPATFREAATGIKIFLEPVATALAKHRPFRNSWRAPGPWRL